MPNTDFQNGVILATVAGGTEIGITPTGNIDITENGEYDVTDYATANVSVDTGNIGYKVTFKVGDDDYYIASCQQGESITEPPRPSKSGYTFVAWQLSDNNISFPYTPSGDVELSAFFQSVRAEMEITAANTALWETLSSTGKKANDGKAICGNALWQGRYNDFMFIGKTQNDIAVISNGTGTVDARQITYNGETYYCYGYQMGNTSYTFVNDVFTNNVVGTWSSWTDAIYKKVLDRYFYND